MAESEKELKNLLVKVKEKSEKASLKLNIQKMKIIESSPIISWQIDGIKFAKCRAIFLGSIPTADGDCSHEIKKMLAPWKKSCDKSRELIEKQKHYFANKGPYNQAMVFPVVMYACES